MKPKPLVVLKNFTVPVVAMGNSPFEKASAQRAQFRRRQMLIRGKGRPGTLPVSGSAITRAKLPFSMSSMANQASARIGGCISASFAPEFLCLLPRIIPSAVASRMSENGRSRGAQDNLKSAIIARGAIPDCLQIFKRAQPCRLLGLRLLHGRDDEFFRLAIGEAEERHGAKRCRLCRIAAGGEDRQVAGAGKLCGIAQELGGSAAHARSEER